MAIISSVLKLVNVGAAVNVDEEKDTKNEKSMLGSDSQEVIFSTELFNHCYVSSTRIKRKRRWC